MSKAGRGVHNNEGRMPWAGGVRSVDLAAALEPLARADRGRPDALEDGDRRGVNGIRHTVRYLGGWTHDRCALAQDDASGMTRGTTSAPRADPELVVRKPNRLWRLAFGLALAVQLIAVYAPDGPAGPQINGLDKVIHLLIFAAPAFAALMAGIPARWALGILAVHAPVSELIQHFVFPHRSGDLLDVIADVSGVALGGWAYVVWARRQH